MLRSNIISIVIAISIFTNVHNLYYYIIVYNIAYCTGKMAIVDTHAVDLPTRSAGEFSFK